MAKFKCQRCFAEWIQPIEIYGLMVLECPNCGHNYMDCLNLEECLEWCKKEDERRNNNTN